MEIRLLKKSEIHLLEAFFFKGWSMLPNYSILSQELKKYASQLRKQNYLDTKITKRKGKQIVGFFHQMQLVMIAHVEYSKQGMSIYSSILHENVKFTWSDYLEQFEKMARQLQCQTIQFQLLSELSPDLNERFFEAGYQKENYHFSKKLDIKKGIALGGGGARGSYAIGVWKYFDEQQIDFDIICGTSIGASIAGLMVSSTVEKAIQMWEEIDTSQILDFDGANTSDISLASLLLTIKEMAKSSLATTGISSAPLYSLIHKYYDLDKLHNTSKQLGVVTVEVPTLEEIDVLLQRRPKEQWIDWMIASGSFFPMMQAKKIGENFYIDGGYRNNIPVDFVYSLGANYIVEVDVQGPGMKKRVSLPERVGHLSIVSPWTLGNILIFDGKRSTQNIQLGYLETKKIFEPVFGFWYSFDQENFEDELEKLFIEFTQFVKNRYDKHHFEYLNRFTRIYKKEVSNEELPLVLLEILGKFADISPFTAYSLFSFEQLLIKQMDESVEFEELHSLGEWFGKYFKELAALSDVQIFQKTRAWLRDNPAGVQRLWDILPEFTLLVLFYQFLEERHERISI